MSNTLLVEQLMQAGTLRSKPLIEAFSIVDRKDFVPKRLQELAYADHPLPIGHDATISQPTTVAFMLELLELQPAQKILDIGSGSGWTTALLASVVGERGEVIGLDIVPQLVKLGRNNISKYSFSNARIEQASSEPGLPQEAPFDRILVSASARRLPHLLIEQLKVGGVLVIPVGESIMRIRRTSGKDYDEEEYPGFLFVPLR